jgi:hypothetical protein
VRETIESSGLSNQDVFFKTIRETRSKPVTLVYGPRLVWVMGLGLIGMGLALFKGKNRYAVLLLIAFLVLDVGLYMSPAMSLARLVWAEVALRFTVFPFAILCLGNVLLFSYVGDRGGQVLAAIFGAGVLLDLSYMNLQHVGGLAFPMGLGAAALLVTFLLPRLISLLNTIPYKQGVLAGVVLLIILGLVQKARDRTRYDYYSTHLELHPFPREHVPVWQALDHPVQPQVIAVAAGYRYYGHNWFLYPAMGSRLQNRLVYVSPTVEGTTPSYTPGVPIHPVDPAIWVQRMKESQADLFFVMQTGTLEEGWARLAPETFEPVYQGQTILVFSIKR